MRDGGESTAGSVAGEVSPEEEDRCVLSLQGGNALKSCHV